MVLRFLALTHRYIYVFPSHIIPHMFCLHKFKKEWDKIMKKKTCYDKQIQKISIVLKQGSVLLIFHLICIALYASKIFIHILFIPLTSWVLYGIYSRSISLGTLYPWILPLRAVCMGVFVSYVAQWTHRKMYCDKWISCERTSTWDGMGGGGGGQLYHTNMDSIILQFISQM